MLPISRHRQLSVYYGMVLALLLLGCGLRLVQLEHYPLGVNQDELSNIYDGYSISETGADRWGQQFPIVLRGFGTLDYRPPLYAWLSAATVRVFGFSVFAGRLVSACCGCLSLLLIFLVAKRLGGKLFALLALLLATWSPWHLLFSRIASEGAMLPPFFLISACYLWQRAKAADYKPRLVLLLGFCCGLGTNTYQAGRVVFFLFALLVVADLWQARRGFFQKAALFGTACLLGASPQLVALATMPDRFISRASGTVLPFSFSYAYCNTLLQHVASHFAADFLFFSFGQYNNLSVARLLLAECLFFYIGLFLLYQVINKAQAIKPIYFYLLLFSCVLPAALTQESPHALRSSALIVLLPLVSAAGIIVVYRAIAQARLKSAFMLAVGVLIVWNGLFFTSAYANSSELRGSNMQVLLVEASKKVGERKGYFERFYIEKMGNQPYLYFVAFCGITPKEFQQADKVYKVGDWDDFQKINNYYFLTCAEIEEKLKTESKPALLLLKERVPRYQLIDSVQYLNDKLYLYNYYQGP